MNQKNKTKLGKAALFGSALIWGSSFFIMKNTIANVPENFLLGTRFLAGALLLCIFFHKRLGKIDKSYFKTGFVLGGFWFWAYWFQTEGLYHTTPGKNAFLTAIYCVAVPFVTWIWQKKKPTKQNFLAALICITGIGLISLDGNLSIGIGDGLTLVGGLLFSLHIAYLGMKSGQKDPVLLTIVQFLFAGLWGAGISVFTEDISAIHWTVGQAGSLAYLVIMCTAVAVTFQSIGTSRVSSSSASLILSLESVFGVLFSVIFYGEKATVKILIGFALVIEAILISETDLGRKSGHTENNDKKRINKKTANVV